MQRKTLYANTTDLFVTIDGLRPYTKYEFSVMIRKGGRSSIYSLTARNTTFEAGKPLSLACLHSDWLVSGVQGHVVSLQRPVTRRRI